jgi:hypothetical protein
MNPLQRARRAFSTLVGLERRIESIQQALGRIEARQIAGAQDADLRASEFRAFSQWGEDGVLQRLVSGLPDAERIFVEFGVEDYREANTRYLLQTGLWTGLVIDGSAANVARIRSHEDYWRYNLKADTAFVTRENIDELLSRSGLGGRIGLLSVDIDGNDYWVLQAITVVMPRIVVCEYNSLFGPDAAISIPYDPDFRRFVAHHSGLYFGASLAALEYLMSARGYALVHVERSGTNAFFVDASLAGRFARRSAKELYVRASYRQARDAKGRLAFLDPAAELDAIASLPVVQVLSGETISIREALERAS